MKDIYKHDTQLQKAYMLCGLINIYYDIESAGGNLHIVLDDGNYEKHHIEYCLNRAIENKDYIGEQICKLLLEFDISYIEQIVERSWEILEKIITTN